MNILVTGCAGFIGYNLSELILSKNKKYKIYGIDNINNYYDVNLKKSRLKNLNQYENFIFTKIDITNHNKLNKFFLTNKIQVVIHLAAQAGVRHSLKKPQDYVNSNLLGFCNILEISKNYKIKHLIFASTSSVYGETKKFPVKENTNTDKPISFYAATKKCNEILAYSYSKNYQMNCTGLRFFTVYGKFGRPDMALFKFTDAILKNKKAQIYNNGRHQRDFTYVDDVTNKIFKLINKPNIKKHYQIFNIASGKSNQLKYFIKLIEKYTNRKLKINNLAKQKGDIVKTHADITKISNYLRDNYSTSLKSGINNFIKWYREYYKI